MVGRRKLAGWGQVQAWGEPLASVPTNLTLPPAPAPRAQMCRRPRKVERCWRQRPDPAAVTVSASWPCLWLCVQMCVGPQEAVYSWSPGMSVICGWSWVCVRDVRVAIGECPRKPYIHVGSWEALGYVGVTQVCAWAISEPHRCACGAFSISVRVQSWDGPDLNPG